MLIHIWFWSNVHIFLLFYFCFIPKQTFFPIFFMVYVYESLFMAIGDTQATLHTEPGLTQSTILHTLTRIQHFYFDFTGIYFVFNETDDLFCAFWVCYDWILAKKTKLNCFKRSRHTHSIFFLMHGLLLLFLSLSWTTC